VNFYSRARDVFKQLPNTLLTTHIVAKFLFGVGIGILLCEYTNFNRAAAGWGLIVVALIVAIPSTAKIVSTMFKS
jgi:F0F1-type ATP synthase assembly protein I